MVFFRHWKQLVFLTSLLLSLSCRTNSSSQEQQNSETSSISGNMIKNDYHVPGEEGTPCKVNANALKGWESNDCAQGFACVNLRGRSPTCHRMCENIGDIYEGSCTKYKGPGHSVCMIEKSAEFRRAVPEGIKLCAIRCGGLPAAPECANGQLCNGECPKGTKCGRVLEFNGPLRCA